MDQKKFIEKYKDSQITIERIQEGDLYNYAILIDQKALDFDEEEIFWTLYQNTDTVYCSPSMDIEIVKLIV